MNEIKAAFNKIFGDMSLSENDVAFSVFEYGYKAGVAAENEACAKVCEEVAGQLVDDRVTGVDGAWYCAADIRERVEP